MSYRFISILLTSLVFVLICSTAYAGNYLDELASEAESTANVSTHSSLSASEEEEFGKMEALLETERPSTYRFYSKLNPKNKEQAFKFYRNDKSGKENRLSHLQNKVMDLYFEQ
ncbi:hypothetical protein [Kaarinaea lacus]